MNLNSLLTWNFKLYRAYGIDVRVHWLLILYIFIKVFLSPENGGHPFLLWMLVVPAIIFAIVLLHEYGHCIAARLVGGRADNIILWPLGGLAMCSCPNTPKAEFITSFGGLFVNCVIIFIGYLIRWIYPMDAGEPMFHSYLAFIIDINITLLLFNLIPCYPLDGGRMFRAVLWPLVGYRKAGYYTIWLAIIISGGLLMYGLINADLSLVLIALFVFLQAWQEKSMGSDGCGCAGMPESRDFNTPLIEKWRISSMRTRIKKEAETEKDIKGRVDRILDKINDVGMERLTEEERHFLNEASRYLNKKNLSS